MGELSNHILLVGTGPMAIEYTKILQDLGESLVVVGKDELSIDNFKKVTKILPAGGGIENWLKSNKDYPSRAIVAVTENMLGKVALELLGAGFKSILVEKPGGFSFTEIKKVAQTAQKNRANVYVGYNRRAYASVKMAQEMIKKDGGVTSFNFEFTEWSHKITPLKKAKGVKEHWALHNSTHVIDLAFFLAGQPKKISTYIIGSLPWHPTGAIFAGAGITKKGALFSYQANWESPGRWSVEMLTRKHRLILRPLEKLAIQKIGSVEVTEVNIDDKYDLKFKPGLYMQVKNFLANPRKLCHIQEQVENIPLYRKIISK